MFFFYVKPVIIKKIIFAHQIGQNDFEWQEVARRVQEDPSMSKPWEIWDDCLIDVVLLRRQKDALIWEELRRINSWH